VSYATLAQARAEGITTDQANDERLQQLLDDASERIEEVTGWWFRPRALTLRLSGRQDEALPLPAPVIALTSVTLDGAALDLDTAVMVKGRVTDPRADVRYPRILRRALSPGEAPLVSNRYPWPYGEENVVLVGTFGFTKADGTTPPADIRDACLRLVVRNLPRLTDAAGQAERERGRVSRETTDGHSYELGAVLAGTAGSWRAGGLTGDPAIDTVLAQYRRPSKSALAGVPRETARIPRWP